MRSAVNPILSVILPVYNAEKYLAQAIESILNQTFGDFELITADDGSEDSSLTIVNAYAEKDDRIIISHNEINQGKVKTVNRLFEICRGQYVTIHDADDWSEPDRLEKQVSFLELNRDFAMCGCSFYEYKAGKKGLKLVTMPMDDDKIRTELPARSQFHGPTLVFRSEIVSSVGGLYRYFKWGEDIDFAARVIEKYRATNLSTPLYYYRIHLNSVTKSTGNLNVERLINSEIRVFLANQRKTIGSDFLLDGNLKDLELVKIRMLEKMQADKSSLHTYFSNYLYSYGFKWGALKSSLLACFWRPSIKTVKDLIWKAIHLI